MSIGVRKVDAVMHLVDDIYNADDFYENVMGLRRGWTDDENKMIGMLFPDNDTELVLHMNKNLPNPNVSFQVEDVMAYVEEYKSKGYRVLEEPFNIRCGKCAVLEDPYGNGVEVMDLTKFDGKPRFDT
jgi:predicted enzyme related to lactoylglutathione lyase